MTVNQLQSRSIVEVAGPDATAFLQGLVSQSISGLGEAEAVFGALLTPQGKISADFLIMRGPDGFLLDAHAQVAASLAQKLSVYKLRADLRVGARPDLSVLAGDGVPPSGLAAFVDPRLAALGWRAIAQSSAIAAADGSQSAFTLRRRSLGVPELGSDFAADALFLTDVNYDALRGVDYRKGCFVGQEVTSRMKRKGEIRKRALIVRFDGASPPADAAIEADGGTIGTVLCAGDGVGLALVRLDRLGEAERAASPLCAAGCAMRLELPTYLEEA